MSMYEMIREMAMFKAYSDGELKNFSSWITILLNIKRVIP